MEDGCKKVGGEKNRPLRRLCRVAWYRDQCPWVEQWHSFECFSFRGKRKESKKAWWGSFAPSFSQRSRDIAGAEHARHPSLSSKLSGNCADARSRRVSFKALPLSPRHTVQFPQSSPRRCRPEPRFPQSLLLVISRDRGYSCFRKVATELKSPIPRSNSLAKLSGSPTRSNFLQSSPVCPTRPNFLKALARNDKGEGFLFSIGFVAVTDNSRSVLA